MMLCRICSSGAPSLDVESMIRWARGDRACLPALCHLIHLTAKSAPTHPIHALLVDEVLLETCNPPFWHCLKLGKQDR